MLAAPSRDWSVCKPILADPWEPFQHAHSRSQTPYDAGLVAKMLACGTPEKLGYIEDRCLHCGQGQHLVAMSGQSSLCLRCANVHVDNWVSQGSQVLPEGVLARHLIRTVPAMFRTTFSQNAAVVLCAFMRCGAPCLDDFYREGRGKARRGGSIVVLHTHGRHGQYHPHRHVIATRGGSDGPPARWEHLQYWPSAL
jgi:Transposase zinc-binding domain/Putative transposase